MKGVGPGTVLGGRYTVHRRVAQDRGTERWTADDTTLGRQVSVLVAALDDHRAAAFVDAARRAASVSHAVLVRILDVGQDDDVAFVVEEILDDARTLAQLVDDGGIPGDEVRRITGEVASALESARQRGMHHLDLTPGDVLRTPDGEIRLRGLEVAGVRAGEDGLHPDEAARRDAVGVVALAYAGLTGLWPLGAGGSGLGPAPRVPSGVASPSEIAAGVPRDIDAICRLTLNDDQGPTTPGDYARQVAPWPSRQVVGKPVVPAISVEAPVAEPIVQQVGPGVPPSTGVRPGAAAAGGAAAAAGAAAAGAGAAGAASALTTPDAPAAAVTGRAPDDDATAEQPWRADDLAPGATAALPVLEDEEPPAEDPGPQRPPPPAWLEAGPDPFTPTDGHRAAAVPEDGVEDDSGDAPGAAGTAALGAGIAGAAAGASAAAGRAASRASAWFSSRTESRRQDRPEDVEDAEDAAWVEAAADTDGVDGVDGSGARIDDADDGWGDGGWAGARWGEDQDAEAARRGRGDLVPVGRSGDDEDDRRGVALAGTALGTVSTRVSGLARRAVDKVSELSPDSAPGRPHDAGDFDDTAPAALVPAEPLTRDESKLALGIVVAFLVVALVIGIVGVKQIGSRTDLGLNGTTPTSSPTASAAPSASASGEEGTDEGDGGDGGGTPEPLAILKVEAYDPGGDGAENNSLTPKTYDGDTSTGWYSENYRSDAFGGLKDGLGLVVDLGPNKKPQEVRLDIPEPVDFEVYVGPDASLEGATKIGEKTDVSGEQSFDVPDDVSGQYIVVWYTGLHPDDRGKRRAWLDEVVVTG